MIDYPLLIWTHGPCYADQCNSIWPWSHTWKFINSVEGHRSSCSSRTPTTHVESLISCSINLRLENCNQQHFPRFWNPPKTSFVSGKNARGILVIKCSTMVCFVSNSNQATEVVAAWGPRTDFILESLWEAVTHSSCQMPYIIRFIQASL